MYNLFKKLFFQYSLIFIDFFYGYYFILCFCYSDCMWHYIACTICNSIIFTHSTAKTIFFYKEFYSVDHGSY